MKILAEFSLIISIFFISACAQLYVSEVNNTENPYQAVDYSGFEEYDDNSTAAGPAYLGDAMFTRKPMPYRKDWKPWKHYYSDCIEDGRGTHFSKTSFTCADPYY